MYVQSSSNPGMSGVGTSSSSDNNSKIQSIQEQIKAMEQKIESQQKELQKYSSEEDAQSAQMAQQLVSQYQQQLQSLNQQLTILQREQTSGAPEVSQAVGQMIPADMPEGDDLQQIKSKFDTFVPGFEDPAKAQPVTYSVEQTEDGLEVKA